MGSRDSTQVLMFIDQALYKLSCLLSTTLFLNMYLVSIYICDPRVHRGLKRILAPLDLVLQII